MAEKSKRKTGKTIELRVLRSEWLSPHMIRVVAGGAGLAAFTDNEFSDHYVKLLFEQPGVTYPEPFDIDAIRRDMPREAWPAMRTYTIRRYDRAEGELAIDFVHHGDIGLAGPWAAKVMPGDPVRFLGPGGAYAPSADAAWHLLVGDEAALPAIGAALEAMPAGARVRALIEVDGPEEELTLATEADVDLTWLHRDDVAPGESDALVDAVRGLEAEDWSGVRAFVHGEAGIVKRLRAHLLTERGVAKEQLSISGYWRRGNDEDAFQAWKRVSA